jgi:thiamine-phosphate pyrophosphorylase
MARVDFSLYLITDRHQTCGRPLQEVVHAALRAGVRAIQLREKDLATRPLLSMARDLAGLAHAHGAKMLVNDRVDICLASKSDGVHLPAEGLSAAVARGMVGSNRLLAVSTHSAEEVVRAEAEGADFILLGPIFDTPSKRVYGAPVGLKELARARHRCRTPLFGIGGITPPRVRDVLRAGAHGVAVIGGVMGAADVEQASRDFLRALECEDQQRPRGEAG